MDVSCQCGAISFKTPLPKPLAVYICHCDECRRQSSSAFGCSAIFPKFPLPCKDMLSCYSYFSLPRNFPKISYTHVAYSFWLRGWFHKAEDQLQQVINWTVISAETAARVWFTARPAKMWSLSRAVVSKVWIGNLPDTSGARELVCIQISVSFPFRPSLKIFDAFIKGSFKRNLNWRCAVVPIPEGVERDEEEPSEDLYGDAVGSGGSRNDLLKGVWGKLKGKKPSDGGSASWVGLFVY